MSAFWPWCSIWSVWFFLKPLQTATLDRRLHRRPALIDGCDPLGSLLPRLLTSLIRSTRWRCRAPGWWPAPTLPPAAPWPVGKLLARFAVWRCDGGANRLFCRSRFLFLLLIFAPEWVLSLKTRWYTHILIFNFSPSSGAWTTSARCILCPWTRTRTWRPRRSPWPCTQIICLLVVSPTRTCRYKYPARQTRVGENWLYTNGTQLFFFYKKEAKWSWRSAMACCTAHRFASHHFTLANEKSLACSLRRQELC